MLTLRFPATDSRLRTMAIATRVGEVIKIDGKGRAVYGPYIYLPSGEYELRVNFDPNELCVGRFLLDVAHSKGDVLLAERTFSSAEVISNKMSISLGFSCPVDMQGFEFRVRALADCVASIESVHITLKSRRGREIGGSESTTDMELGLLATGISPEFVRRSDTRADIEPLDFMLLGREGRPSFGGLVWVVRGIEAMRVRAISPKRVTGINVRIDGNMIRRATASAPTPDRNLVIPRVSKPGQEDDEDPVWDTKLPLVPARTFYFNVWVDFSQFAEGLHIVQVNAEDVEGHFARVERLIFVESASVPEDMRSAIEEAAGGQEWVDDYVNRQPSVIVPARRSVFDKPPERVLVIRIDQMGDLIVSLQAIMRLRQLLPKAHITGLLSQASIELANKLNLFDSIVTVQYSYDESQHQRLINISDQLELRRKLRAMDFDLAIDLSQNEDTRPLLLLSGAKFTAGFSPAYFHWLDLGINWTVRDKYLRNTGAAVAMAAEALIEAIGLALNHAPVVIPAAQSERRLLAKFGIGESEKFILLHTGARIPMLRWPLEKFLELTRQIFDSTEYTVVMMCEADVDTGPIERLNLPKDRFRVISGRISFDELDSLVSNCTALVGNDSGPKHLAALRGANVVSIHTGRTNWKEWGQEGRGAIVLRSVPCTGCGIDFAEACGKGMACVGNILSREVFAALQGVLGSP